MEDIKEIIGLIKDPSAPVYKEWMEDMMEKYPYFSIPAILYLQRNKERLTKEEHENILARIAITFSNRKKLYLLLGEDASRFNDFYPEEVEKTPDTFDTIDKFIGEYGASESKEVDVLTQLIFNPTPEYAQVLAKEHQAEPPIEPKSEQDVLLNKFIDADLSLKEEDSKDQKTNEDALQLPPELPKKPEEKVAPKIAPQADDSLLSESLAKIYIRQKKYDKALEIIIDLNEKFPNRSLYFADQIRFLKKLVLIQSYKTKNNEE